MSDFIISVERKRNPNNIAGQMANVQEAILNFTESKGGGSED